MRNEIPARVSAAMVKAGAVDPRNGNPSLGGLARMCGVHTTTVANLVLRGKRIAHGNVLAVSEALQVAPGDLLEWCTGTSVRFYSPPRGSEFLTERQRQVVDELIRVLVDGRDGPAE